MAPTALFELDLSTSSPERRAPAAATRTAARARSGAFARGMLLWTPVWVALAFLGQLVLLGLLPARAEQDRLDAAELEVRTRAAALQAEEQELQREARMLADGVWQERVRRSLVDPETVPLTLERARSGTRP